MPIKRVNSGGTLPPKPTQEALLSASIESLMLAAMQRADGSMETGRFLLSFREDSTTESLRSLNRKGMRVADARDFQDHAATPTEVDADALLFPEISVALLSGPAFKTRSMALTSALDAEEDPLHTIEPEVFVFPQNREYLRGFVRAATTIAADLGVSLDEGPEEGPFELEAAGATWGLDRCTVPASAYSGRGIRVAVLDTGMDTHHPDFSGRAATLQSFVGQPVQDLHGHGTHCVGTACGTRTPSGTTPRYGIAYEAHLFIGKVMMNSGFSVGGSILAGMNWAIANRCEVISMSLGGATTAQAAYTSAGAAALKNNCLILAAAGNDYRGPTLAPANSPTILSVASLDPSLQPSNFSNQGKIEIAAPGRDVLSSLPMPRRYGSLSGTSMATPHVAGCAALWAQSDASLRGMNLWRRLQASARPLAYSASLVGSGLVQAP